MSDNEKFMNVTNVTPEDLRFIEEYVRLPNDKKILMNGIVIGVNLEEKNRTLKTAQSA